MFLSAVWTLILTAPIHCRGSIGEQVIVMLNFSKSVLMKKQTHLHLDGPRVSTFSANLHFWVNCSFNFCIKQTYVQFKLALVAVFVKVQNE